MTYEKYTYYYRIHYNNNRVVQLQRDVDTDMNAILYIIDWMAKFNDKYSNIYRVQVFGECMKEQNKIMDIFID